MELYLWRKGKMKILYIGDLHIGSNGMKVETELAMRDKLLKRAEQADIVIVCGDMSDAGRPEQYERFKELFASIKDKCILVRGNHDMGDYMESFKSWYPDDIKLNFHKNEYPVWIWTTDWFEMLNANTKCFAMQQKLPEPYNRTAQPPVIVVYDGIGPYYYFDKEGVRFVVLDASTHQLGEKQQQWLKEVIDSSELPIIIQLHTHIVPGGGHDDACCLLWDSGPLLQHFIHSEKILGIFAAHLHFNSVWDWNGKKIVLTGAYGESRFIEVENGKITYIEPLDNMRRSDLPQQYRGMFDSTPLDLHYWCADGVLARDTFWVLGSKGFWDDALPVKTHWGWYNANGTGGLSWALPPEFLPDREVWFSVNFRSTTPWKLLLEENGVQTIVCQGEPGENIVATGSFGSGPNRPFRKVILQQEAPAAGHGCCYMALHYTPTPEFCTYSW